jgi:hypothetical protein
VQGLRGTTKFVAFCAVFSRSKHVRGFPANHLHELLRNDCVKRMKHFPSCKTLSCSRTVYCTVPTLTNSRTSLRPFFQWLSSATPCIMRHVAWVDSVHPRGTSTAVACSEHASSGCYVVRGPKAPCAPRIPQVSLIALPLFPNQLWRRRARWKELVKGFAAMQTSLLQRTPAVRARCECKTCTFRHDCFKHYLLLWESVRTVCGVQECAGKAATRP